MALNSDSTVMNSPGASVPALAIASTASTMWVCGVIG